MLVRDGGSAREIPVTNPAEHIASEDCLCGPEVKPVKQDDGSVDWIYVHRPYPDYLALAFGTP